jgi:hypothetical protein
MILSGARINGSPTGYIDYIDWKVHLVLDGQSTHSTVYVQLNEMPPPSPVQ